MWKKCRVATCGKMYHNVEKCCKMLQNASDAKHTIIWTHSYRRQTKTIHASFERDIDSGTPCLQSSLATIISDQSLSSPRTVREVPGTVARRGPPGASRRGVLRVTGSLVSGIAQKQWDKQQQKTKSGKLQQPNYNSNANPTYTKQ